MRLNIKSKEFYIQKIVNSQTFAASKNSQELLSYLYESSKSGFPPKETTIAVEIFGKDHSYNPGEDPVVRVAIHKLRERLRKYYEKEGKNDRLRIEIPKGHYEITFNQVTGLKRISDTIPISTLTGILLLIILILSTLLIVISVKYKNFQRTESSKAHLLQSHPLWSDYLSNPEPVNVVLADQFFFKEFYDERKYVISREYHINSAEELDSFKIVYPNKSIADKPAHLRQFDRNSLWALQNILPILSQMNKSYYFTCSSDLEPNHLRKDHILYVGSYVELRLLGSFLRALNISYQKNPQRIIYKDDLSNAWRDIPFRWTEDQYHNDLAVVAKLPGPNKNLIILFTCLQQMGNYAASKYLSSAASTQQVNEKFLEKYETVPRFFVIIFEITGLQTVDFACEIKFLMKVEADFRLW